MLPFWYTIFFESSQTGMPVVRPLWVHYPQDPSTFAMENQFLCGADLLVKPVVAPGQHSTSVYFPGGKDARWFDVEDFTEAPGGIEAVVNTPLDKMPVFQRGSPFFYFFF